MTGVTVQTLDPKAACTRKCPVEVFVTQSSTVNKNKTKFSAEEIMHLERSQAVKSTEEENVQMCNSATKIQQGAGKG